MSTFVCFSFQFDGSISHTVINILFVFNLFLFTPISWFYSRTLFMWVIGILLVFWSMGNAWVATTHTECIHMQSAAAGRAGGMVLRVARTIAPRYKCSLPASVVGSYRKNGFKSGGKLTVLGYCLQESKHISAPGSCKELWTLHTQIAT